MAFTTYTPARSASALNRASDLLTNAAHNITAWNSARRTRKALQSLSAHELEDIGLSYADIETIAKRGRI